MTNTVRGKSVPLYLGPQIDFSSAAVADSYHNSYMYSLTPGGGQSFENDAILGGDFHNDRDMTQPAPGLAESSVSLVAPMCLNHLGYILEGAFGAPTFTAGTPNVRTYTSGGGTLPAQTLAYLLKAGDGRRLTGFTVGKIGFNIGRQGGFGRVSVEGAARKYERMSDLALGTIPTALPLTRIPAYRGILRVDGIAEATLITASPSYDNGLDLVDFATDDQYLGGIEPGDGKYSCPITVRYKNSYFADKAAEAFDDTGFFPVEQEWQGKNGNKLVFTAPRCRVAPASEPITGPGGIQVSYDLVAEQSATAPALTVALHNTVADGGYL